MGSVVRTPPLHFSLTCPAHSQLDGQQALEAQQGRLMWRKRPLEGHKAAPHAARQTGDLLIDLIILPAALFQATKMKICWLTVFFSAMPKSKSEHTDLSSKAKKS